MTWETLIAVVGAVSGIGSILYAIFGAGRRVGQLEQRLAAVEARMIDPREWGELTNKVETLYKVYVVDALAKRERGGGNPHGNPYGKSENPGNPGEEMKTLPKEILDLVNTATRENISKDVYEIVSIIIETMAGKKPDLFITSLKALEMTPSEFVKQVAEEVQKVKAAQKST